MSTLTGQLEFNATITETPDATETPGLKITGIVHSAFNAAVKSLGPASVPPIVYMLELKQASGTSGSINFTTLATLFGTKDATGKKLRYLRIKNNGSSTVSVVVGASNGYAIGGAAVVAQPAGGIVAHYFADGLAAIDATHKTIDWSSGAAANFELTALFG